MDSVSQGAVGPMEGMENIPVMLGFNGSRSYARSVALIILVAGFLALNAGSYARWIIMEQPFALAVGWKALLAHLWVVAMSVLFYSMISRQTMEVFPQCFSISDSSSTDFTYGKIQKIDVVRNLRGQVLMMFLKAEGVKRWLPVGGFQHMDTLSEIFISAVLKVNPSVSVKPKTRPSLIVTGSCCLMTVLVTYYYLWISVGLTGNTLPLLPLTPVYLLVGLELVSVALLGWTLTGYRVSSGVSCLLLMFLPFQLEYLITMHLHRHMGF